MTLRERMENLVKIAKERNELHQGSAWWELKENLKFHTVDEVDYRMIDVMWKQAELDDGLDKWDEQFLNAVSGEYKTQQQLDLDNQLRQHQLYQAAIQLQHNQLQAHQAQNQQNPYQNAGLLNGLKGIFK